MDPNTLDAILPRRLPKPLAPAARRLLALDDLRDTYRALQQTASPDSLAERLLHHLQIRIISAGDDLNKIPARGPAVVFANHPYGVLDGAVLAALLLRRRADLKVLAHRALAEVPELAGLIVPVDVDDGSLSLTAVRSALRHWQKGGLLLVFPAGEVAHFEWSRGRVADPAWQPGLARLLELAVKSRCRPALIPVHIDGRNSALFQGMGLVHPKLRTALLVRELLNKRGRKVTVRVGHPIAAENALAHGSPEACTRYLRWRVDLLSQRGAAKADTRKSIFRSPMRPAQPLAAPVDPRLVAADIQALPPGALLLQSGEWRVFLARAAQIPAVLQEIGRLRELTFRAEGEGTGRAIDLDRFDWHYAHLFLWNTQREEIAGAYRLAVTQDVVRERGLDGLYTATLFRFGTAFLDRVGPSIELGRSFIRAEYQRAFAPLLLLWKGIGLFVSQRPECHSLFGPVSMSRSYQPLSRDLMVRFFERCGAMADWAHLVQPRLAPPPTRTPEWCHGLDDLSDAIADLEPDRAGVPVLLRHYVRLGGHLLGFNLDPEFSNALDGLILVDLRRTEPRLLAKYLGPESAARILAPHRS
jgi:putative hemolysin